MTDSAPHLNVTKRDPQLKPGHLRRQGFMPANISGLSESSQALTCSQSEFLKFLKQGGETGLLYLDIDGQAKSEPALIEEIQLHPTLGDPLHVSFRRVNLQEKIEADVPLEFVGYEEIPGANLLKVREEVEIEALPADIPEFIEVDLSGLTEIGQSLLLKDLKLDLSKMRLTADEEDLEKPVALIQEQVEEVEPEPAEAPESGAEGDTASESADSVGAKPDQSTEAQAPA